VGHRPPGSRRGLDRDGHDMNTPLVIGIGAVTGLLGESGINFDPRTPGKRFTVAAGILRGALVAVMSGLSMYVHSGWVVGSGFGMLYGALFGLMICLSRGATAWQHARLIIPSSAVTGALSGALVACFAF
jgi:hypothetical protein